MRAAFTFFLVFLAFFQALVASSNQKKRTVVLVDSKDIQATHSIFFKLLEGIVFEFQPTWTKY
jgi:hypothetical protein